MTLFCGKNRRGGLAEWSNAPHSKCGWGEIPSQVQILYPPQFLGLNQILAAHFALQNTNSVGAQSEGEAERQNSQSGFSSKKVRILTKRHRTNKNHLDIQCPSDFYCVS